MSFCTKCGHQNPDDADFCAECGAPLHRAAPTQVSTNSAATPSFAPPTQVVPSTPRPNRKYWMIAAGAVGTLVVAGVGLFFMLAPESPSKDVFGRLAAKAISEDAELFRGKYCLSNFAYDKDPVYVNQFDSRTQQWLSVLTQAGLYNQPEAITSGGFFPSVQLKYAKTEAGQKAIKGNRLCIADGVTVVRVEDFSPPQKAGDAEFSRAQIRFGLTNPMPWIKSDEARGMMSNLGDEFTEQITYVLKDGKWAVASAQDMRGLSDSRSTGAATQQSTTPKKSEGFLDSLKKMLGISPVNDLMGQWSGTVFGAAIQYEFKPDEFTAKGPMGEVKLKASYETRDDKIIIVTQGPAGQRVEDEVVFVDRSNILIASQLGDIRLKRN